MHVRARIRNQGGGGAEGGGAHESSGEERMSPAESRRQSMDSKKFLKKRTGLSMRKSSYEIYHPFVQKAKVSDI